MHRIFTLLLFAIIVSISALGQQMPLYTQYVYDPYLINPSLVGSGGHPEVNVLYRRQWTQIADGPKTMQFDAQLPLNSRVAVGLNVYNDKSILLSSISSLLTFGYRVPLSTNQTLGFGLSAGLFTNRIDLSQVAPADASDPALLSTNTMALNGQFGAHYRYKTFVLGFTLSSLFEHKALTPESFQKVKFGELQNQIWFASYRITLSPDTWFVQPNVSYRHYADNTSFYETSALVSYRNKIDVGGGYRQNFGPSAIVRITWKQLSIGAAYDFPSNKAQVSTGGSQEFQLKWRFVKDDSKAAKKNTTPTPVAESEKPQPTPVEKKPEPKVETVPPVVVAPVVVQKQPEVQQQVQQPVQEPQPQPEVIPDFYFVVGSFEKKQNAEQFYISLRKKGLNPEMRESKPGKEPHYFYVHLPQYKTKDVTLDKILELQKTTGFKDAWFTQLD